MVKIKSCSECFLFLENHSEKEAYVIINQLDSFNQDFWKIIRKNQVLGVMLNEKLIKNNQELIKIEKIIIFKDKLEIIELLQNLTEKVCDFKNLSSFTLGEE